MPIDASIYSQIQPVRINSPFAGLSEMLAQREQQKAIAEQRRALAQQTDEKTKILQQQQADMAAIDAAGAAGGNPEDVLARLPQHLKATVQKQFQEAAEWDQKVRESRAAAEKAELGYAAHLASGVLAWEKDGPEALLNAANVALQVAKLHGHDVSQIEQVIAQDPTKLKPMLQSIIAQHQGPQAPKADYTLGDQRFSGETNQAVATAQPKAPEPPKLGTFEDYVSRYATQRRLKPEQLSAGDIAKAKAQYEAAGRAPAAPKDERLVQIMGPQGSPIWVRESDAVGKPAAQAARAVTGAERQALAFYNRADEAAKTVTPLEENIGKMGLAGQARLQAAPNWLQSPENQSYRQAQRAFTEARLRKESGAAIPPSEYENDAKTYFAQPGDTPKILEQKRKARQTVLDGLAFSAGKAYEEFYGEPRPGSGGKPKADPLGIR